jgi:hypothetical protein
MPVADLPHRPGVHVGARLARIKKRYQNDKKHHVSGKGAKHEGSSAVQKLAGATTLRFPIVVSATASTTGRTPVNRRFASKSGLFPFGLRWGGRKDGRHRVPL